MTSVTGCQRGFTLLEMLIAMTVLAVGLFGLAELQVAAMRANTQSSTLAVATSLAQGVLEQIAVMEEDDPFLSTAATDQNWPPGDATGNVTLAEDGVTYRISTTTTVNYLSAGNITMVEVKVESLGDLQLLTGKAERKVTVRTLKRYTS